MCANAWLQGRGVSASLVRALISGPPVPGVRSLPRAMVPACQAELCWRLPAVSVCAAVTPLVVGAFAHAA